MALKTSTSKGDQEKESTPLQPMNAAAWRKLTEEGEVIQLPGGLVARIRTVSIETMILNGEIPDLLTPIAIGMLFKETTFDEIGDDANLSQDWIDLVHKIVPAAMVEPRIALDGIPTDDLLTLEEMGWDDKMAVFHLAVSSVDALATFRKIQEEDVESVSDGEGDGDETE